MEKRTASGPSSRRAARAGAVLLAITIAAGSLLRESHLGRTLNVDRNLHFWSHVALFALLTLLVAASTTAARLRWLLFAAVLLFGYGTEFYEHLKDGFPVESPDVLADSLGTCSAVALWYLGCLFAARKLPARLR